MLKRISKFLKKITASCRNVKIKENKKVKKKDQVEPSAKLLGSKVEKSIEVKQKNSVNECNIVVIKKITMKNIISSYTIDG